MWQEVPLRNLKDFVLTISAISLGTSRLEAEQISCEISTGMSFGFFWAINVDDVIYEGCKWPVEEHKRIGCYTFIVSLLSQPIVDHFKYSLSCGRFLELQLYCQCNVLPILARNSSLQKFMFFSSESQPAGLITKTKRANVKLRKVRQRWYKRYGRYMKELVRNGGIIMDFIRVRKSLFNHQSWKYHQI